LEIQNTSLFFAGIIIIIIGMLIVIFDYPQIQYFEQMQTESYLMLESQDRDIHQRLQIEFMIGFMVLIVGIILTVISILKKSL